MYSEGVCSVDGMLLNQSHVDLVLTFCGIANGLCLVLSDVQIWLILHVILINIHQLMILPEKIMVWYR